MPTRDHPPAGAPCWIELVTSDVAASREFYAGLFDWTSEESSVEFGGYVNFARDGVRVAGATAKQPDAGFPDLWTVYLASDDARKTTDAAAASGGVVHVEPMAVADFGVMAFVADPGGAMVGVWEPGTHYGFGVLQEDGAPSWFELHTRDYDAALRFYEDVFGWETAVESDTPTFRYTTARHGDAMTAGVADAAAFLPEAVPAHWSVYFGVGDADAALARVVELGGTVRREPEDTPYGRLAEATDVTGALFKLVADNAA